MTLHKIGFVGQEGGGRGLAAVSLSTVHFNFFFPIIVHSDAENEQYQTFLRLQYLH